MPFQAGHGLKGPKGDDGEPAKFAAPDSGFSHNPERRLERFARKSDNPSCLFVGEGAFLLKPESTLPKPCAKWAFLVFLRVSPILSRATDHLHHRDGVRIVFGA